MGQLKRIRGNIILFLSLLEFLYKLRVVSFTMIYTNSIQNPNSNFYSYFRIITLLISWAYERKQKLIAFDMISHSRINTAQLDHTRQDQLCKHAN